MSVFHEQRICVKFFVNIGKSVTETFEMLKMAFGEEAMCRTQTYEWWKRFKEAELRLMMIRVRNGHQRRKLTIMLQKFVKSSVQIVV
jgi:hypothetical protein